MIKDEDEKYINKKFEHIGRLLFLLLFQFSAFPIYQYLLTYYY